MAHSCSDRNIWLARIDARLWFEGVPITASRSRYALIDIDYFLQYATRCAFLPIAKKWGGSARLHARHARDPHGGDVLCGAVATVGGRWREFLGERGAVEDAP